MEYIDFHSHVLPGIDDGSKDPQMSAQMLKTLYSQGVRHSVLSSHFYGRRHSPEEYLKLRQEAFERLMTVYEPDCMPKLHLGAEVALSHHMMKWDLSGMKLDGTNIIMLEMPGIYEDWIDDIMYEFSVTGFKIMIAHLDRVIDSYPKQKWMKLLDENFIYQINNDSLSSMKIRKAVEKLAGQGADFVLGSDAHNITDRNPNFDEATIRLKKGNLSREFVDSVERNQKKILKLWQ